MDENSSPTTTSSNFPLVVSTQMPISSVRATQDIPTNESMQQRQSQAELEKRLHLQDTKAANSIEFKEVFTVPLNDLFYQVYRECYQIKNKFAITTTNTTTAVSNSRRQLLDARPERWYQEYKYLLQEIKTTNFMLKKFERDLEEIREDIENMTRKKRKEQPKEYEDLQKEHSETYAALLDAQTNLNKLQYYRKDLLKEIKINGHELQEDVKHEELQKFGYTFAIFKENFVDEAYPGQEITKKIIDGMVSMENTEIDESYFEIEIRNSQSFFKKEKLIPLKQYISTIKKELIKHIAKIELLEESENIFLKSPEKHKEFTQHIREIFALVEEINKILSSVISDEIAIEIERTDRLEALQAEDRENIKRILLFQEIEYMSIYRTTRQNELENKKEVALKKTLRSNNSSGSHYGNPFISTQLILNTEHLPANTFSHNTCIIDQARDFAQLFPDFPTHTVQIVDYAKCSDEYQIKHPYNYPNILQQITQPNIEGQNVDLINAYHNQNPSQSQKLEQELKEKAQQWRAKLQQYGTDLTTHFKALHEKIKLFKGKYAKFLENNPLTETDFPIMPGTDFLSEAIKRYEDDMGRNRVKLSKQQFNYKVFIFSLNANGFYNQEGQSLEDFMKRPDLSNKILILPHFDENGVLVEEVSQMVINPKKPGVHAEPKLPTIKFVETQVLSVHWKGKSLSEVTHSFSLFPKERKKVIISHETKLAKSLGQNRQLAEAGNRQSSGAFEENLQNELANAFSSDDSHQETTRNSSSSSSSNRDQSASSSSTASQASRQSSFASNTSVSASAGFIFASAKASYDRNRSKNSASQSSSSAKSMQNRSSESALSTSMSQQGQEMSRKSRDVSAKNIQNAVRKVASETSQNNKLEIIDSSSEQYNELTKNKQSSEVESENTGRTVNYNFHQLQNIYSTKVGLKDVKIVINTGCELVEDTGINNIRVYELEEFNKIYSTLEDSDLSVVLCAYLARKILKQYSDLLSDTPNNQGILRLSDKLWQQGKGLVMLKNLFEKLKIKLPDDNKVRDEKGENTLLKQKIATARDALKQLKKLSFDFNEEATIVSESTQCVNAAAYHVDAQLGLSPATEPYIEQQRDYEIKAKVLQLKEQEAKIEKLQIENERLRRMTTVSGLGNNSSNFWTAPEGSSQSVNSQLPVITQPLLQETLLDTSKMPVNTTTKRLQ